MYFRRIAYFENLADKQEEGSLSRIRMQHAIMNELAIDNFQNNKLYQWHNKYDRQHGTVAENLQKFFSYYN